MLMFVFLIYTFLVNSLLSLVLFDLGASWSFVSHPFFRDFDMIVGELEFLLRASIANEHQIYALSVC